MPGAATATRPVPGTGASAPGGRTAAPALRAPGSATPGGGASARTMPRPGPIVPGTRSRIPDGSISPPSASVKGRTPIKSRATPGADGIRRAIINRTRAGHIGTGASGLRKGDHPGEEGQRKEGEYFFHGWWQVSGRWIPRRRQRGFLWLGPGGENESLALATTD